MTGGRFFRVANATDLTNVFIQLSAETSGSGLLARAPAAVGSNDERAFDVLVEPGVESAVFALTQDLASDNVSLSLRTPSGGVITTADASLPGIKVVTSPNSAVFEILAPEAGVWQMVISSEAVTNGQVDLLAFARHDGVRLNVTVEDDVVVFPEVLSLSAAPLFEGEAIVGASVQGIARRPDGSEVPVTLRDDGQGGDLLPGDGIYAGAFSNYSDDGTYVFELTATVANASTFAGEALFISVGDPSSARPVPDFVRTASTTAVVSGVPDFVVATVEYGPETINLKSRGRWVTAYIELPKGFRSEDIISGSIKITAVDDVAIDPIQAESAPIELGDFDGDNIPDLMVKFDRRLLQQKLFPGMRAIRLEGELVTGEPFVGERTVGAIRPGK